MRWLAAALTALISLPITGGASTGGERVSYHPCAPGAPSRGWCGDGGPAVAARLAAPGSVLALPRGAFAFSDTLNSTVREVTSDGKVHTVASLGSGPVGCWTGQLALAADGRLLVVSPNCASVFELTLDGAVALIAGDGRPPSIGGRASGKSAGSARAQIELVGPTGVSASPDGTIWIADAGALVRVRHGRARRIRLRPATELGTLAVARDGAVLAGAPADGTIVRLDPASGRVRPVAGCHAGFEHASFGSCDVGWADPLVRVPAGFVSVAAGGFLLAERARDRIDYVDRYNISTTLAGNGQAGFAGDGGPAHDALVSSPGSVAVEENGDILVADTENDRIRLIAARDHTVRTVAGGGTPAWLIDQSTRQRPDDACGPYCGSINYDRLWSFFYLTNLPLRAAAEQPVVVHFVTSRAASVTLTVVRGERPVRHARRRARAGNGAIAVSGLPRGRYTVQLTGHSAGDAASDRAPLRVH